MIRYLLEYKGETHTVESCATCPARTYDQNGFPKCEIRNVWLHAHIKGPFPRIVTNEILKTLACPVRREGKRTWKWKKTGRIKGQLNPIKGGKICTWCGMGYREETACQLIIGGRLIKELGHEKCFDEFIATKDS